MDSRIRLAQVSDRPVDPHQVLALVEQSIAGASVLFAGVVRDHDPEAIGEVVGLTYTAHPTAAEVLPVIIEAALVEAALQDVLVAVVHRVGQLAVGEPAFVVAASAAHRREAFAVCELVVERVKQQLPVWKQQFEADGSYRWSGMA